MCGSENILLLAPCKTELEQSRKESTSAHAILAVSSDMDERICRSERICWYIVRIGDQFSTPHRQTFLVRTTFPIREYEILDTRQTISLGLHLQNYLFDIFTTADLLTQNCKRKRCKVSRSGGYDAWLCRSDSDNACSMRSA